MLQSPLEKSPISKVGEKGREWCLKQFTMVSPTLFWEFNAFSSYHLDCDLEIKVEEP